MATQLDRPSRTERKSFDEKVEDARSYRVVANNVTKDPSKIVGGAKKTITFNFICMCAVASTLDIISFFVSEIPGVGVAISITSDVIFIPWFIFSGIKFNARKIGSMGATSVLEDIPLVGNLPFILANVIWSYYSK